MDGAAEGQVAGRGPGDVELVGPVEDGLVAVGRADDRDDRPPDGHVDAAERDRLEHRAGPAHHRRLVAQRLLHRPGGGGRVGPHQVELVGVAEQLVDRVADQLHGGAEAGGDQQADVGHQLQVAEPAVLVLVGDQHRQQVVAGLRAALGGQAGDEVHEFGAGLVGHRDLLRGRHRLDDGGVLLDEAPEPVVVLGRHAQHPAHHRDRNAVGDLVGQVELLAAPGRHLVEEAVDLAHHLIPQGLDRLGGEGLRHRPPQPGVLGRVLGQHAGADVAGGGAVAELAGQHLR